MQLLEQLLLFLSLIQHVRRCYIPERQQQTFLTIEDDFRASDIDPFLFNLGCRALRCQLPDRIFQVNMVFTFDNLCINLTQLLIILARHLVERLDLLREK